MKHTFLLSAFILCLISLFAKANTDTPPHIKAVQKKIEYEPAWLMKNSYYKSSLKGNQKAIAVFLNNDGSLNHFERRLNENELPKEISNWLKRKYSNWHIENAKVCADSNGNVNYFATMQKRKKRAALKFTSLYPVTAVKQTCNIFKPKPTS